MTWKVKLVSLLVFFNSGWFFYFIFFDFNILKGKKSKDIVQSQVQVFNHINHLLLVKKFPIKYTLYINLSSLYPPSLFSSSHYCTKTIFNSTYSRYQHLNSLYYFIIPIYLYCAWHLHVWVISRSDSPSFAPKCWTIKSCALNIWIE